MAQQRRALENGEFERLSRELPIARAISGQHIDKTSVVRLAATFIRLNRFIHHLLTQAQFHSNGCRIDSAAATTHISGTSLEALDGFLVCISIAGEILYVSETISIYLGLSQIEMIGNNIFDYVHCYDRSAFEMAIHYSYQHGVSVDVNLRMRSSLSKRVHREIMKGFAGYKVLRFEISNTCVDSLCCFGTSLPSIVASNLRLGSQTFAITVDCAFKICYMDPKCQELLKMDTTSGISCSSYYDLVHCDDLFAVTKVHIEVMKLGSSKSSFYRMLGSDSHIVYVETCALRIPSYHSRTKIDYITLVTTVL